MIALTGLSWFVVTGLAQFSFAFSSIIGSVFGIIWTIIFIVIPIVNHVRMFVAIRRHNKLMAEAAVPQNLSTVLRREKKVAMDMAVISLVVLLSLAPTPLNKITQASSRKLYVILQPWSLTMVFLISSINPLIYVLRNKALKDGVKSVFFIS